MISAHTIVVVNHVITLQECSLYRGHVCALVNAHHICPKSWFLTAGVEINTPMIDLCPTCHANVHAAIDGTIKGQDVSRIPPRARRLADRAFAIADSQHLTPGLTL